MQNSFNRTPHTLLTVTVEEINKTQFNTAQRTLITSCNTKFTSYSEINQQHSFLATPRTLFTVKE